MLDIFAAAYFSRLLSRIRGCRPSDTHAEGRHAATGIRVFCRKNHEQRRGIILPPRKYNSSSLFRLSPLSKASRCSGRNPVGISPFLAFRHAKRADKFCRRASFAERKATLTDFPIFSPPSGRSAEQCQRWVEAGRLRGRAKAHPTSHAHPTSQAHHNPCLPPQPTAPTECGATPIFRNRPAVARV